MEKLKKLVDFKIVFKTQLSDRHTQRALYASWFHIIKFDVFHRVGKRKWGEFNELHVTIFGAIKKQQEFEWIHPIEALNSVNKDTLDLIVTTSNNNEKRERQDKLYCVLGLNLKALLSAWLQNYQISIKIIKNLWKKWRRFWEK